MPILREQTREYLFKFRDKTGFYNLLLNPYGVDLPPTCSGAPNVAIIWISYGNSMQSSHQVVLQIDNDKYISEDNSLPYFEPKEAYPHIEILASSGGEYYFSNSSPTLFHRISVYEINYDAELGGHISENNTMEVTKNNTVVSFCLGELK